MASTWTIKAIDHCFGPFTLEQMRAFAAEGRLASHSLVAADGGTHFAPASEFDALSALFRPAPPRPVFFTAEGDLGAAYAVRESESSPLSRFVIVADMKQRSIAGLEQEIM